ncbi:MAG TPA: SGNH/GDSL hydrolase family protein, partial [Aggregatilineales bacterium]|nr:SGNH/GDSL hydrolase family protein [Aggregatilineales bacterium]
MTTFPFTRRHAALLVALILAAVNGWWGSHKIAVCVIHDDMPSAYRIPLVNWSLLWTVLAGTFLIFALLSLNGSLRAAFRVNLKTRSARYAMTLIFPLLILSAVMCAYLLINIESNCLEGALWMFIFWMLLTPLILGLLYPNLGGRIALSIFSIVFTLLMIESGVRLTMRLNPIYDMQIVKPNDVLGWTLIPDTEFTWASDNPACVSFRTPVQTNSPGLFDREHEREKPENTIRIAMLGDSFVQAMQVNYEERATQVLEKRLAQEFAAPNGEDITFEVLNFGVNSFSTGQVYLMYQEYVSQFDVDYVFLLESEYLMDRNIISQ